MLYSGDEIARENDDTYHNDPLKPEDSRDLHRGDMNRTAAENRKDLTAKEGKLYASIQRLEGIRRSNRVFNINADQIVWVNEREKYRDVLTGENRPAKGVELPAYGFA